MQRYSLILILCLCALIGCARDDADALRARLDQWFVVDRGLYFKSEARCTAAMYSVAENVPRDGFAVQSTPDAAKAAFRAGPVAAIQMRGYSPNDLTDAMLLSGRGTFGKEALRAGARAVDCLTGTLTEGYLHVALTRPGALLAYDRDSEGVIVLDHLQGRLFYVAGAV